MYHSGISCGLNDISQLFGPIAHTSYPWGRSERLPPTRGGHSERPPPTRGSAASARLLPVGAQRAPAPATKCYRATRLLRPGPGRRQRARVGVGLCQCWGRLLRPCEGSPFLYDCPPHPRGGSERLPPTRGGEASARPGHQMLSCHALAAPRLRRAQRARAGVGLCQCWGRLLRRCGCSPSIRPVGYNDRTD